MPGARKVATAELEAALEADEASLFTSLGSSGVGAIPRDPLDKGIRIYAALSRKLRAEICGSEEVERLVAADADELVLAAAIADLIAAVSHQIPAATVTALLLKHGVQRYCADLWTRD
jgi:hypothetical protein